MKRIIITIASIILATTAFAQGSDDACLFSQTFYQGTAKALGMANALGAIGGDMTAVSINPAGMGLYRSNELTTTLSLLDNFHQSTYYDIRANGNRLRLSIPNIGYVAAKERSNYRKLRFTQFGIGLTRTNDFNSNTFAKGFNPTSSKIDNYLAQIDGYSPSDIQSDFPNTIFPAWSTYLIDIYEDEIGEYYSSPVPQGRLWQSQKNDFTGRSEEWIFAGSANYGDRLFIGASIGLNHVKRKGSRVFEEWMPDTTSIDTDFNQWSYTESLSSTAMGLNAKIGLIYHVSSWLRLGAAFHSPTLYKFDESWQTETESQINWATYKYISPESVYEYTLISPLKGVVSAAFVVGQRGLLSLDAEYINYGSARLKADDYDYSGTNASIAADYGKTFNIRLGTEWRTNSFYLRAGTAYYGSPFGFGKAEGSVKKASLGIGLPISENATFDFAYELTNGKNAFTLYNVENMEIESVTQKQVKSILAVTLKMRL